MSEDVRASDGADDLALDHYLRDIDTGKSPVAENTPAGDGEWGVLKVSAVQEGWFQSRENKVIRDAAHIQPRFEVRPGDLLMTRANTEALVGLACIAETPPPRLMLSDKTLRLVVDEGVADPAFVSLALLRPAVRNQVRAMATGTSAGMKNISQRQIRQLRVPRASLEQQRRIVAVHAAFERRIGALEQVLGKLDLAREALSSQALSESQRAGWRVSSLDEVATVAAGVTLGSEPVGEGTVELPYLRVANVMDGRIDTSDVKSVRILQAQRERFALRKGDLLLTEGGDLDKLGRGAVWDGRINVCLHQNHVFRVRCGAQMSPDFLALYASSIEGRAYFQRVGKQTTNLASINSTQVRKMPVPVPPVEEQDQLLGPIRVVRGRIAVIERLVAKLRLVQLGAVEDLLGGRACTPSQRQVAPIS
ncbi:restriction endonuclease subunit S [Streptomyces sp. NPDC048312]|uniref:restriction endonuclease subunit S n=1 Tax=Streptomyces sp. NPDC048312 TaxID=3155485 RepID=UPI0033FAED4B